MYHQVLAGKLVSWLGQNKKAGRPRRPQILKSETKFSYNRTHMDNSEDIILYKDNNNITVSKPEHQNT